MRLSMAEVRHALRNARSVPIDQIVADSRVKICGRVLVCRNSLKAPVTGRRCVWSRIIVRAEFGRAWRRILDEEEGVDFLLQDDSGIARVTVQKAQALLVPDERRATGFMRGSAPELSAMLNKRGVSTRDSLLGLEYERSFRISESVLEVDQAAAVLGTARFETINEGVPSGYRGRPRRAVLKGAGDERLILTGELQYIDRRPRG